MFEITFTNKNIQYGTSIYNLAYIVINDYKESLKIPIGYWNKSDYIKSWVTMLEDGLNNQTASMLVTSMHEPSTMNFFSSWILYYENESVFIQEKINFLDDIKNFNLESLNLYIPNREVVNEDGLKISEWKTDIKSIYNFYNDLIIV